MRVSYNGVEQGGGGGSVTAASMAAAVADPGDAADVNAALSSLTVDALDGTGWTGAGAGTGGATATWETSPARLSLALADGSAGGAGVTHATLIPGGGEEWDIAARADFLGAHDGAARIGLRGGASGVSYMGLDILGNGTVEAWESGGGSPLATATGPDQTQRESGLAWFRVAKRVGEVAWAWGVAADASSRPTSWTVFHSTRDAAHLARATGTSVTLFCYAGSGVSGGVGVNVLDIRASGRAAPL